MKQQLLEQEIAKLKEENDLLRKYKTEHDLKFPNGFVSWYETHHEVVEAITLALTKEDSKVVMDIYAGQGHCAMYTLAVTLTDEFELLNKGRKWDGEFFDEVDLFLQKKLY